MQRKNVWMGILIVVMSLCLSACKNVQVTGAEIYAGSDAISLDICEEAGHDMGVVWYGDPPDCTKGGYRAVVCKTCGRVDENACGNVEPTGHAPYARELVHGNCREDTIIVYICSVCGEETGYDRYFEAEEHKWVWKDTLVWDEEEAAFVSGKVQCCERCNMQL